jgi:hypothetical protein
MPTRTRPDEEQHPQFDAEASLREAKARHPLARVLEQRGIPAHKKNFPCPFCGAKSAGLFTADGAQLFKCFHDDCLTERKALDEIGFIMQASGLSRKEAFTVYLKEAGVWKERMRLKDAKPTLRPPDSTSVVGDVASDAPSRTSNTPPLAASSSDIPTAGGQSDRSCRSNRPPGTIQSEEAPGLAVLKAFYDQITLTDEDRQKLYIRRGIVHPERLGFRSSQESNRAILEKLADDFDVDDLMKSGLWKTSPESKARKPNSQFFGVGILRKMREGEKPGSNEWADEDGNLWGWCQPILIPYFDEFGHLVKLRPHKGGAKGATTAGAVHPYVPRDAASAKRSDGALNERFHTVWITEGEFKAAVLWQALGAGSATIKPDGVVCLPGISFGKHYDLRQELDGWLRRVGCGRVLVAFDNEEKGDPKLPGYKADWAKRFDAAIWARVLAMDLADRLRLHTQICTIPSVWRSAGKADFDGVAGMLARGDRNEACLHEAHPTVFPRQSE